MSILGFGSCKGEEVEVAADEQPKEGSRGGGLVLVEVTQKTRDRGGRPLRNPI